MRSGRRGGLRGSLALLLGLSLLGSALSARAAMAAGPVGRVGRSSALPAGLAPVLRHALGPRAVAVASRQGLLEPATTWSQQAKVTVSDAASGDWFGVRVALSGNTALVTAPGKNSNTGAAYVFVRS